MEFVMETAEKARGVFRSKYGHVKIAGGIDEAGVRLMVRALPSPAPPPEPPRLPHRPKTPRPHEYLVNNTEGPNYVCIIRTHVSSSKYLGTLVR